eukprot:scaffold143490_cov27-Tisochrysis_lutea.AAC.1
MEASSRSRGGWVWALPSLPCLLPLPSPSPARWPSHAPRGPTLQQSTCRPGARGGRRGWGNGLAATVQGERTSRV